MRDISERQWHINYKELFAVKLALSQLADSFKDCYLLLRIDNTTAIAYVNKMGGLRHEKYNILARDIWQWAEKRKIVLKATYDPSKENQEADRLSRMLNEDAEWSLSDEVFVKITENFGFRLIDLFASAENKKCDRYVSWLPDPQAFQIDAFTMPWNDVFFYAFPPFVTVLRTLEKILQDKARGIIVVQRWGNQPWYPLFERLVIRKMIFGPDINLLISVSRDRQVPSESYRSSTSSGDCIREAFLRRNVPVESLDILLASLSKATKKQYQSGLKRGISFCEEKGIDIFRPNESDLLLYLTKMFENGCSYGTLNTDRCAISLITSDKIGEQALISRFLKGCFKLRPTNAKYSCSWDVNVVLDYLEGLRPLRSLDLKDLSHKVATLLALCSAQRVQSLSKIRINNIHKCNDKLDIVFTDILKTSRAGFNQPVLTLPRFVDRPEICPYRHVLEYLDRTKRIRDKEPFLFISFKKPCSAVSSQTLSRWIKVSLSNAGIDTKIFTGHSTRHAAISNAATRGVDLEVIRKTAGWSDRSTVFARFYNRPVVNMQDAFAFSLLNK